METLTKTWHPLELLWLVLTTCIALTCVYGGIATSSHYYLVSVAFFVIVQRVSGMPSYLALFIAFIYGMIAYEQTLYGDAILKFGYSIPMHI